MFFPVLLAGDFGWWSWLVFALPNVIGAASVGLLLRKPGAAARSAQEHRTAFGFFALITLAFQVYAVMWLARETFGGPAADVLPFGLDRGPSVTAAAGLFWLLTVVFALLRLRAAAIAAGGVIALSTVCLVLAGLGVGVDGLGGVPALGNLQTPDDTGAALLGLAFMTPAIVWGFLICPYFDPTINRVRRETGEPAGSYAFAFGFGGPFLLMVLGTLLYAGYWHEARGLPAIVMLHIIVQAAFTAGVHLRALFGGALLRSGGAAAGVRTGSLVPWRVFGAVFLVLLMGPLGNAVSDSGVVSAELRPGYTWARFGYEAFMLFYGLVFPLYGWVFAIRPGRLRSGGRRARTLGFLAGLAAGGPLLGYGYVAGQWLLVGFGVAAAISAPLLVAGTMKRATNGPRSG